MAETNQKMEDLKQQLENTDKRLITRLQTWVDTFVPFEQQSGDMLYSLLYLIEYEVRAVRRAEFHWIGRTSLPQIQERRETCQV